jgi:zinc transport system substrate-binding protein
VFHPEWGYFARDYGLEELAIEFEGKEPSARQIKNSIDKAKAIGIREIFLSTRVNPKIASSVAGQIGALLVHADALSDTFIDDMKRIANTLR